nr:MND1-interacting protein 1-like [Ipomoea trifida]
MGSNVTEKHLEVECPKRFNLSHSVKSLMKTNVATFDAGFRSTSNYKNLQTQSQAASSLLPSGYSESQNSKNQDVVNSVLSRFRDLNLDESTEHGHLQMDKEDEIIVSLIHQIKDLERQRKQQEEWAHQKVIQAARKLIDDLTELKMLRMEKEDTQSVKKGNFMKKHTELENALRKARGEVDRIKSAVRKLETENAEVRAEIEACKLTESESATTSMEFAKREKKWLKKISALEKQRTKLQEDIAAQKQKCSDLAEQLAQDEADQKKDELINIFCIKVEAYALPQITKRLKARLRLLKPWSHVVNATENWCNEQAAKEVARTQMEEEQKFKEAAEAGNKRKLEALHVKVELDIQRLKDDLQHLERDLSMLKSSELSADRECVLCLKDEASVVFLPCAHLAVCADCNKSYGKKGRAACPCCRVPIEQRIPVFGIKFCTCLCLTGKVVQETGSQGGSPHTSRGRTENAELENTLRKASSEVDRVNSAVRKLETENAEIRAGIEAYELSASESITTSMEVKKREKKWLKKISAREKQISKLQEDIAAQKQKLSDLAEQLAQDEADQKKPEEKWCNEHATKQRKNDSSKSLPEVECPKRFNLSPSVKSLVKKNVATFDAGFRSTTKTYKISHRQPQAFCLLGILKSQAASSHRLLRC